MRNPIHVYMYTRIEKQEKTASHEGLKKVQRKIIKKLKNKTVHVDAQKDTKRKIKNLKKKIYVKNQDYTKVRVRQTWPMGSVIPLPRLA